MPCSVEILDDIRGIWGALVDKEGIIVEHLQARLIRQAWKEFNIIYFEMLLSQTSSYRSSKIDEHSYKQATCVEPSGQAMT